jgi:hypothetical protein
MEKSMGVKLCIFIAHVGKDDRLNYAGYAFIHEMICVSITDGIHFRFEGNKGSPSSFGVKERKYYEKALQAFERWAEGQFGMQYLQFYLTKPSD